jgi:hypothetical protein
MPQFRRSRSELDAAGIAAAGAMARRPSLDLKFSQQRAVTGKADQIFIALKAALGFNACGRALEAANPLAFSAQMARSARRPWTRWLEAPPAEACAATTDRQKCVALAAQPRSVCSGTLRLSPP